jgi:hypothetical protein
MPDTANQDTSNAGGMPPQTPGSQEPTAASPTSFRDKLKSRLAVLRLWFRIWNNRRYMNRPCSNWQLIALKNELYYRLYGPGLRDSAVRWRAVEAMAQEAYGNSLTAMATTEATSRGLGHLERDLFDLKAASARIAETVSGIVTGEKSIIETMQILRDTIEWFGPEFENERGRLYELEAMLANLNDKMEALERAR